MILKQDALLRDVEVKKITTNSGRDFLHIHILQQASDTEEADLADGTADQGTVIWQ